MKHRDDIDGLRAVAVLPIVLFHAGFASLSGGFIGVDIFFVISGFLITSIILREMDAGLFSIATFYKRRIVRIFPALFVMLAVALVMGCVLLLPAEIRLLGYSAAAAVGFASNIYFWETADYFASAAELKPLLHTWSLGVEEQFYLLYPLLIILVYRRGYREKLRLIILVLTALSFAASLLLAFRFTDTGFYMLPSRAWELGIGALAALGSFPQVQSSKARDVLSVIGLTLIILGVALIDAEKPFPAPWALLPCVGTALLLAYGKTALTNGLLSAPPMRWVGAISYSLYLWHWPIISFYRLQYGLTLTMVDTIGLLTASFVVGACSYKFVEQPFLNQFRSGPPLRVIGVGATVLASGVLVSLGVVANADYWRTFPPEVRRIADFVNYRELDQYPYQFRRGECFFGVKETGRFSNEKCLPISPSKPNMVVLGDSHAAQYWRAIELRYPNYNVLQATASGCRPTLKLDGAKRCTDIVNYVLDTLVATKTVDKIVLAGRWRESDIESLEATIRMLRSRGVNVIVIGPTVEYQGDFPSLLARAVQSHLSLMTSLRVKERKTIDDRLQPVVVDAGGMYVSVYDLECPGGMNARTLPRTAFLSISIMVI